jgi:hypothetical protein
MKQQIIDNINDPEKMEDLYRQDQRNFEKSFSEISGDFDSPLVRFWQIRLTPERTAERTGSMLRDLIEPLAIVLFTAILVLIPALFTGIDREFFYLRNVPLIAFNGLIIYSFRLNKVMAINKWALYGALMITTGLYINLLPTGPSDSNALAMLHVPLMLWCFLGLTFVQFDYRSLSGRMNFIRFSGELVIMTGLILLAGGVLTVVTMGLFSVIGMDISQTYANFIAIPGGVAAPVIAWYLIRNYPGITSKIAPVIARIFTPVVLVTLTVYLFSLIFSKNSILENREMLLVFNVMLLGVLTLIIFSVSEINREKSGKNSLMALLFLSAIAIIINSIALAAIISRVLDGLTPNRTVVLITNILVFINLILIAVKLYRVRFKGAPSEIIEKSVAKYLTVYAAWTVIAIFIVPLVFGFR